MTERSKSSGVDREGSTASSKATDGGPIPPYAIRKCRGHWHVCIAAGEDDLITKPPQLSYEQALDICGRLNDGESLEDIEAPARGMLAGYTRLGPQSDAARMDWLEAQGVESIYLRDGRQINPASLSLRAALDLVVDPSWSTPNDLTVDTTDA